MIFVRVKKKPTELKSDEFIINSPSFIEDIKESLVKKPINNLMSVNYLRQLVSDIGTKYIGPDFDALTQVNVANFKGTPCDTPEIAHETIKNLFKQSYPKMFDAYIEYHIKHRPNGTRVVYYLGSGAYVEPFLRLGFEEVLEKDLDKILGGKPKKVVGKPAITDKEAADKNEIMV